MSNHKTICIAMRDYGKPDEQDKGFARRLNAAINSFQKSHEKQSFVTRYPYGGTNLAGWVLGIDSAEGQHVYVLQEGTGEKVSSTEGSKAAVDALVNVLRSRGYTCIKRSDNA